MSCCAGSCFWEIFERIYPSRVLWDLSDFHFVLSEELQQWVYHFLDKPASDTGMSFTVGHVVPPDVLAQVSIMEIYSKNGPLRFHPHYFSHTNQAVQWMALPQTPTDDLNY